MKRRELLSAAGVAGAVALASAPRRSMAAKPVRWKMVTTWPKNFPGLGVGAEKLA